MRPSFRLRRRDFALVLGAAALWPGAASDAAEIQDRFFAASDGARLHYLEAGPPDARTLVFVPGWRMPAFIWRRQIETFSKDFRVVAFDPRGQGDSDIPASGYEPQRRGRDLGELIDHLGGDPVVIVGWSLGVLDALAYVTQAGDRRVAGLVLIDNSIGEDPAPRPAPKPASKPGRGGPTPDDAASMRAFVRGLFETPQDPAFLDQLTAASLHTPEAVARALRAYDEPRSFWRDAVYSVRRPVLYAVRPRWRAQGEALARKHPSAELSVFEGAGHALFVDQPDRFDAVLSDFLKRRVWP